MFGIWLWSIVFIILLAGGLLFWRSFRKTKTPEQKHAEKIIQAQHQPTQETNFIPEGYYWCGKCQRAHNPDSKIGKLHLEHQEAAESSQVVDILGTGNFKCLCFRKISGKVIADFREDEFGLPYPIGEQYQFDPSCPVSGIGSIVIERDGKIYDYDPRQVQYIRKESPEYAYGACNYWKGVVGLFWKVPEKWWKAAATWFATAVLILLFITTLLVFD